MKLGELFVELGTKGNTKELEKTLKQLKEAEKEVAAQIKLNKDLAKATSDEEKALIKKNYAQKQEIAATEKVINKNKERNKTIVEGIKGFTRLIGTISLAIGVLDRFANASAKSNQNILTLSQNSGIDVNTINKYASAARGLNYNVSQEAVAQSFAGLSENLRRLRTGEDTSTIPGALGLLPAVGGRSFNAYGMNATQFMEALRDALKGVSDEWASDILGRLGISTDLLPMLRMSAQEFAQVRNRFPSEDKMREEQRQSLELQEQRDEIARNFQEILIKLYPVLNDFTKVLVELTPTIVSIINDLTPILVDVFKLLKPIASFLNKTYKWLTTPIERKDLEWADKAGENVRNRLKREDIIENTSRMQPTGNKNITITNNFDTNINTTQAADTVTANSWKDHLKRVVNGQVGFWSIK